MRHILLSLALFTVFIPVKKSFAEMQDFPIVKLQALDKSTARTVTFEAKVGTTIEYGSLFIKIQSCRKSDPLDKPESAAFLQIWEVPVNAEKSEWVFSGWMFASSPALSAMDHAVYDVWVLDCLDKVKKESTTPKVEEQKATVDQEDLEVAEPDVQEGEIIEDSESQTDDVIPPQEEKAIVPEAEESSQPIDKTIDSVIENLQNQE